MPPGRITREDATTLSAPDRRTVLRSGTVAAGFLAFGWVASERSNRPESAAGPPAGPITGTLVGWLVLQPDGGGQIDVAELDAASRPIRQRARQVIAPGALAQVGRQANQAMLHVVAESWGVSAAQCSCRPGRILHAATGRSVPFAIWTDFA
jgi:hypothetical protein